MNNFNEESDLLIRLRKLEKSQARYRAAFLSTAAIAVVVCTMGAKRQAETLVQTKSLEIVNDDAKVLARFSSVNGKGDFRTFRADGKPLVSMFSSVDDSGRIELNNADGKPTIVLSSTTTGAGIITVNKDNGERSVVIGSSPEKNGGVWIYNQGGNRIAAITAGSGTFDGVAETYSATGTRTGHLP
jgi:hypothetical protein